MNMKVLFCCIGMLLCVLCNVKSEEREVPIYKDIRDNWTSDNRSLHIDPVVTHDGRTVYIRFASPCEGLWITVENEDGLVVFSESPDMSNGELSYAFEIDDSKGKAYHIEIKLDGVLYWGDFLVP